MEDSNEDMGASGQQSLGGLVATFDYLGAPVPEVFTRDDFEERQSQLSSIIEREIIPRLVMFHAAEQQRGPRPSEFTQEEIAEFALLSIGPRLDNAEQYFNKMQARGHSLDSLFENFLAPTARYLGELWRQDLCDFVNVTIGVARLQQLMAMFSAVADLPVADLKRRVLLTSLPDEQHLFGLHLIARTMSSAGWDVQLFDHQPVRAIVDIVAREWFGVVGMTLGARARLPEAARLITSMRKSSLNTTLGVVVGGPAFAEDPESAILIGADALADDSVGAIVIAKKLLLSQLDGWR